MVLEDEVHLWTKGEGRQSTYDVQIWLQGVQQMVDSQEG